MSSKTKAPQPAKGTSTPSIPYAPWQKELSKQITMYSNVQPSAGGLADGDKGSSDDPA